MTAIRHLAAEMRGEISQRLAEALSRRPEVQFGCIHGSFLDPDSGFRDIDIAVWVEPSSIARGNSLEYQWELSSWLERRVPHPVDAKVLNYSSLGFHHGATGGQLLFARDNTLWFDSREQTWQEYLDFAPLARQILFDPLDVST